MMSAFFVAATTGCSDKPANVASKEKPPAQAPPSPAVTPVAAAKPDSSKPAARPSAKRERLKPPFVRTTLSGVYTADEANEGRDLYLGFCASCHAAVSHTGPVFRLKWAGRPLSDLFSYMHANMPKNDPASLDDYQYGVLLAYILEMNKMPAGKTPLSPDSTDLAKIRIDTIRTRKR